MRRIQCGIARAVVLGMAAVLFSGAWSPGAEACCLFGKRSSRSESSSQAYAMGKRPKRNAQASYQCPKCKMTFDKPGDCPMCKLKLEKVKSKSPGAS